MNGFGMGWGMGWTWIVGVIVLIALVLIILKVINTNNHNSQVSDKSVLDGLKERYAKGELDRQVLSLTRNGKK